MQRGSGSVIVCAVRCLERPEPPHVLVDRGAIGQRVGEQRLADSGAVRGVAPADHGGHAHAVHGRRHLRDVDDLGDVEPRVVGGLAEAPGERLERGLDERLLVGRSW